MGLMLDVFGTTEYASSYGLTDASPTCFNAFDHDTVERELTAVDGMLEQSGEDCGSNGT
ncbi:hypothetical protein BDY21DRAFT_372496 [Lineolata rhizophorae]|uniref:Uncharacterized protein n=1 Tax=Lineolata rhizophorae TaxID=578093 RepID=A0A6A6NY14_9PEZI|nr:hypothetical protein BDY21DRAFT_372496 [Lineolata rhizophorae]